MGGTRPAADWLATYGRQIDNVRIALDWAFSQSGDAALGIALTVAAIPLWFQLSLTDECRVRVQQALASVAPGATRDAHARDVMQLYAALGLSRTFTTGLAPELMGVPLHYLGEHTNARRYIERMLNRHAVPANQARIIRFKFDQPVAARIILAQMLWLQGFPDQAMRTAQNSVEEARSTGHAISLCDALAQAECPVTLLVGDWQQPNVPRRCCSTMRPSMCDR